MRVVKPMSVRRHTEQRVITFAVMGSIAWFFGVVTVALFWSAHPVSEAFHPSTMGLNELGDFAAGAASPLALLWLIVTVWLQHGALAEAREQFREQREINEEDARAEAERLENAARLKLPYTLLKLSTHWVGCAKLWRSSIVSSVQSVPQESLKELIDLAASVPNPTFKSIQKLVEEIQIFDARMIQAKVNTDDPQALAQSLRHMIIGLSQLIYLTERLYSYARFRVAQLPYAEPSRDELITAALQSFYKSGAVVDVYERLEEALDQHEAEQKMIREIVEASRLNAPSKQV